MSRPACSSSCRVSTSALTPYTLWSPRSLGSEAGQISEGVNCCSPERPCPEYRGGGREP